MVGHRGYSSSTSVANERKHVNVKRKYDEMPNHEPLVCLLPPANEGKEIFSKMSVCHSVRGRPPPPHVTSTHDALDLKHAW